MVSPSFVSPGIDVLSCGRGGHLTAELQEAMAEQSELEDGRRRAWGEIAGVLATGVGFIAHRSTLRPTVFFAVPCCAAWLVYVVVRLRSRSGALHEWGLRVHDLGLGARRCAVVTLPAAAVIIVGRAVAGWQTLPPSILLVLALYPVWGIGQQLFVQSMFARNLRKLGVGGAVVVPAAAVLFGLVHLPDWPLAGLCTVAGAVWTLLYLRTPNIIPLGISHGWLGALTYYMVLGRDAWDVAF